MKVLGKLTASVCTGCTAKRRPATVANGASRRATSKHVRTKSVEVIECKIMFVRWNQNECKPNKQKFNLK